MIYKATLNMNTYLKLKLDNKLDKNVFHCIDNSYLDNVVNMLEIKEIRE